MLESLYSETGLLKEDLSFHHGLNLIIGSYAENRQQTGINGIGKSSLVRLIDYALLSDGADKRFSAEKYDFLRDEKHTITLKLKIGNESYYIHRGFGKLKGKVGFGRVRSHLIEYDVSELRQLLLDLMFPINDEKIRYEGNRFRTLFNFFIKDDLDQQDRSDPMNFVGFAASKQELASYNFYLLDLPNSAQFQYAEKLKSYKGTSAHIKILEEKIAENTGKKIEEFRSEVVVIERRIEILENSLEEHKFLEIYKDVEDALSESNNAIGEKLKEFHTLSRKLRRIQSLSLNDSNVDQSDIQVMYEELSSVFAGLVRKSLEEIIEYRKTLVANRIRHNIEKEKQLTSELGRVEQEISALEEKRAALYKRLEEKGQLDVIVNTYNELLAEKSTLGRNVQLLEQIDTANEQLQDMDVEISEQKVIIAHDLRRAQRQIDSLRSLFREVIENAIFLSEEQAGSAYFDVSLAPTRKRDQLPFKISIEVPKADAFGRFKLKLVAYDLMVFLNIVRTQRNLPRFLVHDGVYHGISKRTMVDTLNYIYRQSQLYPDFQYFATFNEDELYISDERRASDGTLDFDISSLTVARYTDSRAGMIFKRLFA